MPELETQTSTAAPKPTTQIAMVKVPTGKGHGFDPETEKPWGVDPDTDELISVTPSGLMALRGLSADDADALYCRIAGIEAGAVFFSPLNEPKDYRPPINISSLKGKLRAKIDKILGEAKS